jgi:hypothetical protein
MAQALRKHLEHEAAANHSAVAAFLADLTELTNRHGIGIAGSPVLFMLQAEDRQFSYRIDADSNLSLG